MSNDQRIEWRKVLSVNPSTGSPKVPVPSKPTGDMEPEQRCVILFCFWFGGLFALLLGLCLLGALKSNTPLLQVFGGAVALISFLLMLLLGCLLWLVTGVELLVQKAWEALPFGNLAFRNGMTFLILLCLGFVLFDRLARRYSQTQKTFDSCAIPTGIAVGASLLPLLIALIRTIKNQG